MITQIFQRKIKANSKEHQKNFVRPIKKVILKAPNRKKIPQMKILHAKVNRQNQFKKKMKKKKNQIH